MQRILMANMQPKNASQPSVEQPGETHRDAWGDLLREFSNNATIHGLKYTNQESGRGLWRRTLWRLACMAAFGCLLFTISVQIIGLFSRPTLTHVSVEPKEEMEFPAVTLCSLNKVRKSTIAPGEEDYVKLMLLQSYWLSDSYNVSLNTSHLELLEDQSLYVSHRLWPTLLTCSWDGKDESCFKMFVTVKTDFGYCFTFNDRNSNSTARVSKRTGSKYGLSVIANIQQNEYFLDVDTESAGLRVLLHGYNETPLVDGRGFDVAPGKATKVSLDMMTVKNLPPPYTTLDGAYCMDGESPKPLALFKEYDLNACRYECRYDYIFSECQCRSTYDPDEFMDKDLYKSCICPVPCEWSLYSTRVTMGDYPSQVLMEVANRTSNYTFSEAEYRQNFLKLTIAYDAFFLETVRQVPKYTLESIISAFGGQMGMFLGASVLSLVEFVEFLIQLIIATIKKRN